MPNSVKVLLDDIQLCQQRNNLRPGLGLDPLDCTGGGVDPTTYTMEQYVLGVLKAEAGPSAAVPTWHPEALKAHAVIMRTYGWGHVQDRGDGTYEIGSSDSAQTFFPEKPVDAQRYSNAVNATSGQYLSHPDGQGAANVVNAQYRTRNGDPTNPCPLGQGTNCPLPPDPCPGLFLSYFMDAYLKGVPGPISNGETRSQADCNSAGFGQIGAQRLAIGNSNPKADPNNPTFPAFNYKQILVHYYTGVHIRDKLGLPITPFHRWNPLTVDWGGGATTPPPMKPSVSSQATIQIQNTGESIYTSADFVLSCQWRTPNGSIVNCLDEIHPDTLNPGATNTVTLTVTPPATFSPGTYTLLIDMKVGPQFFHNREGAARPWFTLNYQVLIQPDICPQDDNCGEDSTLYLPVIMKKYAPLVTCHQGGNLIRNAGFESSLSNDWVEKLPSIGYTLRVSRARHSGSYGVEVGGADNADETLYQRITLPHGIVSAKMSFWLYIETAERDNSTAFDTLTWQLRQDSDTGRGIGSAIVRSNKSRKRTWVQIPANVTDLRPYGGKTIRFNFRSKTDSSNYTIFRIDDIKFEYTWCQ